MTQYVKMNYKNDKEYARQLWKCGKCGMMDSQSHLLFCSSYSNIRQDKDLSNNKDLCKYLHEILQSRTKDDLEQRK